MPEIYSNENFFTSAGQVKKDIVSFEQRCRPSQWLGKVSRPQNSCRPSWAYDHRGVMAYLGMTYRFTYWVGNKIIKYVCFYFPVFFFFFYADSILCVQVGNILWELNVFFSFGIYNTLDEFENNITSISVNSRSHPRAFKLVF